MINKKVILVGNFGVGKTSLTRRFVHQKFSDEYLTTLGVKIDKKQLDVEGQAMTLLIWDIAGEVMQTKVPKTYFLGAHGVIYVFDVTRPSTFEHISQDRAFIREMLPKAPQVIVGNKVDLISEAEVEEVKTTLPEPPDYFSSAKTGIHVEDMFLKISKKMLG